MRGRHRRGVFAMDEPTSELAANHLVAGKDYPRDLAQFRAWFGRARAMSVLVSGGGLHVRDRASNQRSAPPTSGSRPWGVRDQIAYREMYRAKRCVPAGAPHR